MAEEDIILRFEGQDDGASATIERIASLLQGTVVSVDDLLAAGFRMSDITAALDSIAGGASTAEQGMAGMAAMTKEMALALGQANDIAGRLATVEDTLTQASMSDAQAFAELTKQTRMLSEAQNMAFAAIDRATASETAQAEAMTGWDRAYGNLAANVSLFEEALSSTTDRASSYTMVIGRAATETSAFAQEQLSLAERMGAGSETVTMLADKVTQLAIAEGLAENIMPPLTSALTAYLDAAERGAVATQSLADAQGMGFRASAEFEAQLAAMRMGLTGTASDLEILRTAFLTTFDSGALQGAGYSLDAISTAFEGVMRNGDLAAITLQLVASRIGEVAAAALIADDTINRDAISMIQAADAARLLAEAKANAAQAAYAMAVADDMDAATVGRLKNQMEAATAAAESFGAAQGTAAAETGKANAGFGLSQFLLFTLGMMALSAGKQFLDMGMKFDDTMTIIQGKTMVSDQQIQQWTDSLRAMAAQSGFTMDVLAQGLDIVTAAGFRATDATDVLQQGMELARATGGGLAESTNLLTASLTAYGQTSASAAGYAQLLFVAIANGKQNVQELTQMLGSTIDTAAAAGISFQDLVNAETLFSKSSVDSSLAARDFQTFIAAIGADSNMTAAQVAKLSQTFDSAKFATLDWAGKLEMLGKISGTNVAEFNQLIGGADAAKNALAILGISTDQLAKNAKAAGLSFDPILYDSLKTASEKLLYLDTVSGGSEANLKKLTVAGVHPLNDALAALDLKVSDVGTQFAKTHPAFNQAAFDSLDLKDKLLFLWDAVGHDTTAFASFIGGAKNLGVAANIMGVDLNNSGDGAKHFGTAIQGAQGQLHNFDDSSNTTANKTLPNLQSSYDKTSTDIKSQSDKVGSAMSALAASFSKAISPALIPFLNGLAQALTYVADHITAVAIAGALLTTPFLFMLAVTPRVEGALVSFGRTLRGLFDSMMGWIHDNIAAFNRWSDQLAQDIDKLILSLPQKITDMWHAIVNSFTGGQKSALSTVIGWVGDVINQFLHLMATLVGGSIVPDMVNKITAVFQAGGALWNSTIGSALSTIESTFSSDMDKIKSVVQDAWTAIGNAFTSAKGTLTSIAQAIGSDVNSALSAAGNLWKGTVDAAMSSVVATVQRWVGAAMSAGAAVGNAIGDGLNSAVGWVKAAAGNIAGAISSILHHSTPEEGPLHGDDQWGQHFGDNFAVGMLSSVDKLRTASLQMASSVGSNLVVNTPALGGGVGAARDGNSSLLLSQILTTLQEIARQQGSANVISGPSVNNVFSGTLMPGMSQTQIWQVINAVGGIMMESGARGATQQGGR